MKNIKNYLKHVTLAAALLLFVNINVTAQGLRLAIAGLNHNHVYGILNRYKDGSANIVGIAEPNKALWVKFGKIFHIPDSLFFTDINTKARNAIPHAGLSNNAAANHVDIVEI